LSRIAAICSIQSACPPARPPTHSAALVNVKRTIISLNLCQFHNFALSSFFPRVEQAEDGYGRHHPTAPHHGDDRPVVVVVFKWYSLLRRFWSSNNWSPEGSSSVSDGGGGGHLFFFDDAHVNSTLQRQPSASSCYTSILFGGLLLHGPACLPVCLCKSWWRAYRPSYAGAFKERTSWRRQIGRSAARQCRTCGPTRLSF
jgi:hypothetical protein